MGPTSAKFSFVLLILVNGLLWSQSRYSHTVASKSHRPSLFRRQAEPLSFSSNSSTPFDAFHHILDEECHPLSVPDDQQCRLVTDSCPSTGTFLSIEYLQRYFCAKPSLRPLVFTGLVLWLVFLFSTLGIGASDFFCPNLASIAQALGLDENVAGVTFLAFGNGSPDVFSTFSAMRANSGSLAVGELLGAASFIVSVVVGSMCLIKPFHVIRGPFLRDVGFFTVSVAFLLFTLYDGKISAWESGTLIVLYLFYVSVVVVGSYWERRQERKRQQNAAIRSEYASDEMPADSLPIEPYHDDDETTSLSTADERPPLLGSASHPRATHPNYRTLPPLRARHSDTQRPPSIPHFPSFSLLGALEFRQVVNSLARDSSVASLAAFESPLTPFAAGHYHRHTVAAPSTRLRGRSRSPGAREDGDPWDAALGLPLSDRHREARSASPVLGERDTDHDTLHGENGLLLPPGDHQQGPIYKSPIPSIAITSPIGSTVSLPDDNDRSPPRPNSRRTKLYRILATAFHILFPTLHEFRSKPWYEKLAAIFATPAVLALTVTLPVVITPYGQASHPVEKLQAGDESTSGGGAEARLVDFEEEGVERVLVAENEVEHEMHELHFNKWLMACQCVLGPIFCAMVLFSETKNEPWIILAAAISGLATSVLVMIFADRGNDPGGRLIRCFMGFAVAVVWIMAIADEVVSVLQTFGFIFGLSDAIIGLTIFAVGNSLADLVANMSVAAFAPIMGFSACFGGPMLNILLGIGVSGTYVIRQTGTDYTLNFSSTLLVSAIGLLSLLVLTLIYVPLNGFLLTKRWGVFLICCYLVIMSINVVVEVTTHSKKQRG
ncbi:hypothetical protein SISSUDRAFT_1099515 [Sistotremastrum suecicum HHB10207 ss-3]|uniref:Sodium/calcium exchanger membrane region domain-containing protein n=1 Tax=Sistotremastrum suecicum HHB10207 ss-3 TaxID=1314776 RepID=A0A166E0V7_9AGAM|nr:hypothetical protein SISSUDRAFT_1099515 [Sistotremastrum suecicum HHB10207 ss-3]